MWDHETILYFLHRVVPIPSSFYRIFKNTLLIRSFFVESTTTSYNFFKPYLVFAESLKQSLKQYNERDQ